MSDSIALFCLLYPGSFEKKKHVLSLLEKSPSYYRSEEAQCTTWCYLIPSRRPGAPMQIVNAAGGASGKDVMIAGMEVYTNKSALSTQTSHQSFQNYHATVKKENLYSKDEDLVAWYPAAGFAARGDTAGPYGKDNVVMVAIFTCKEESGMREKAMDVLRPFAEWIKAKETGTVTYILMTRPKAPAEILVFERYQNLAAVKTHGTSKEFRAMFKQIKPFIKADKTLLNEFEELDISFVGNVVGGGDQGRVASKL